MNPLIRPQTMDKIQETQTIERCLDFARHDNERNASHN